MFIDGVSVASSADTINYPARTLWIGKDSADGGSWGMYQAYVSNLRVINGTGLYSSNFTPSTVPLSAVANTKLLIYQDNRLKDNSGYAMTGFSCDSIQQFSPFTVAPSTAVAGSAYFDGTGDYLTISDPANNCSLTNPASIEFWVYPLATTGAIMAKAGSYAWGAASGIEYQVNAASTYTCYDGYSGSYSQSLFGAIPINQWTHIAVVFGWTGGYAFFVNGAKVVGWNINHWLPTARGTVILGANYGGNEPMTGYIGGVRTIRGPYYTNAMTSIPVPTSPFTYVPGTQLLMNCSNAGIVDAVGGNNVETVGNLRVSTSVKKYSASILFDGTGDYMRLKEKAAFVFGTGDFTIEMWLYKNSTADMWLLDWRTGSEGAYPVMDISGSHVRYYANTAFRITGTTTVTASTWHHIALCRSGTSTKLFLNGIQEGVTYTDSSNYLSPEADRPVLGIANDTATNAVNGYIEDFRITKGVARYTSTFTPPGALPTR